MDCIYTNEAIPWGEASTEHCMLCIERNRNRLDACDAKAKAEGALLGRIIYHPYADGQAVYQIVKVNKASVHIRVCTGLGDDWILPAWGQESTIPLIQAINFVAKRDAWSNFTANYKVKRRA